MVSKLNCCFDCLQTVSVWMQNPDVTVQVVLFDLTLTAYMWSRFKDSELEVKLFLILNCESQNEERKDRSQVHVPDLLSGGQGQEAQVGTERDSSPGLGQPASPRGAADLPAPVPGGPRQSLVRVPLLERRLSHAGLVEEVWVWAKPVGDVLLALHSPWPHSADHQEARPAPAVRQLQGTVSSSSSSCYHPAGHLRNTLAFKINEWMRWCVPR